MTRKLSILVMALFAFILAACGGGAAGGGGGGGGSVSLDQTFNQDGVSFKYPSGWVASGEGGQYAIASSQAALDKALASGDDTPTMDAGEQAIVLLPLDAETATLMQASSPLQILETMTQSFGTQDEITFAAPTETTLGGKSAAKTTGSNATLDSEVLAVDLGADSGYLFLIGIAPKGDLSKIESNMNAIAQTVTVTPQPPAAG